MSAAPTPNVSVESAGLYRSYTLSQKIALWLITWAGYLAIRIICPTLRFSLSYEEEAPSPFAQRPFIYSFWHRCVFPAAYFWRNLQLRVMTSRSFDGEYIARIIQRFGFIPVRGSSHRGAVRGLLGMRREIEQGWSVAFTIDGPRGPRYVAKPGPVFLARVTGAPMSVFHIAIENAWVLNTWDQFVIPKPFSRALIRMARRIVVPPETDDAQMESYHRELQQALDRVREFAEANVKRVGSQEFPLFSASPVAAR